MTAYVPLRSATEREHAAFLIPAKGYGIISLTFKLVECRWDDFAVIPGGIKRYKNTEKAYIRMPFQNKSVIIKR